MNTSDDQALNASLLFFIFLNKCIHMCGSSVCVCLLRIFKEATDGNSGTCVKRATYSATYEYKTRVSAHIWSVSWISEWKISPCRVERWRIDGELPTKEVDICDLPKWWDVFSFTSQNFSYLSNLDFVNRPPLYQMNLTSKQKLINETKKLWQIRTKLMNRSNIVVQSEF